MRKRDLPRCARVGCKQRITIVAWREQDPYCTTACLRADLGIPGWERDMESQAHADAQYGRKSQDKGYAA